MITLRINQAVAGLAGVGGAYYSLTIVPTWVDGLTKGVGWIAIALVIFGFWRPGVILAGAYLFGALQSLVLTLKARNMHTNGDLLNALGEPAALGMPYQRE